MADVNGNGHGRDPEPGETLTYVARPRSITAASRRIESGSAEDLKHVPKKPEKWQDEAWQYFDAVPEIKFAGRFNGNALSRLRMYPAVIVDQDSAPVPIQDAVGEDGVTAKLAADAVDETSRLGDADTISGFLHEFGVNLTVPGDSYFVATPETPTEGEQWNVYSESAITKTSKGLALREKPGARPDDLPEGTLAIRIWRRHSRWPGLSDSNMRAILAECEELLIYSRQFRAIGKSRNNAGILFLSSKLDLPPRPDAPPGTLTTIESGIFASMTTPTYDDASASSVVPHIVRGEGKPDELIKHYPLDRKIDDQAIARVTFLISRCAHGLDTPVEVLTGVADVNHWNAWQIEDQSYRMHLQPLAMVPATGLARDFLRPALLERGSPPEVVARVVYALDSAQLTVRPNRTQDAKDAFDRLAISWDAFRQHLGFSDGEAPTDLEIAQRVLMGLGDFRRSPTAAPGETIPGLPSGGDAASGGGSAQARWALAHTLGLVPDREQIVLAATSRAVPAAHRIDLGQRLGNLEQKLRDRIQVRASEAMTAALRIAGNRLKARVQGNPVMRAMVNGVDALGVVDALGADAAITAAGGDGGILLDGSFDDVGDDFDEQVREAQDHVVVLLRRYAVDDAHATAAVDRFERNQADNRTSGRAALVAALVALGTRRLFTPDGRPDLGEYDARLSVPAGLVREALALAGGSSGPGRGPSGTAPDLDLGVAGGVALGPDALEATAAAGLSYDGYAWQVGWPSRPFDPHQQLDGVEFVEWDDEVLSFDDWPADENGGLLFPGDHDGCQCVAMPLFTESTGEG